MYQVFQMREDLRKAREDFLRNYLTTLFFNPIYQDFKVNAFRSK